MPASSSLPMRSGDPRRVFLLRLPKISLGPRKREFLVYFAGALVSRRRPIHAFQGSAGDVAS
jgi:hypothetical protein